MSKSAKKAAWVSLLLGLAIAVLPRLVRAEHDVPRWLWQWDPHNPGGFCWTTKCGPTETCCTVQ